MLVAMEQYSFIEKLSSSLQPWELWLTIITYILFMLLAFIVNILKMFVLFIEEMAKYLFQLKISNFCKWFPLLLK